MKDGVIPTLNLPIKSFTKPQVSRLTSSIEKRGLISDLSPVLDDKFCYQSFTEFQSRLLKLKLPNLWKIKSEDTLIIVSQSMPEFIIPKFEIYIEPLLQFTLRIYGWMLTNNHEIYSKHNRSFKNITLTNFIKDIESYALCPGITMLDEKNLVLVQKHIIPKSFSFHQYSQSSSSRFCQVEYSRSKKCSLLQYSKQSSCSSCHEQSLTLKHSCNRKDANLMKPAALNAPIKFTSPERIKLTLQGERLKCKLLESRIAEMQKSLQNNSKQVDSGLSKDFISLYSSYNKENIPPFMKLFWEEQQKYNSATSSSSIRYHPMIIKYCLSIAAKSSSAYSDLRYDSKTGSGILVLPSLRTLRDYKNYIRPKRGFNDAVVDDLSKKTANFTDPERYVTILFDEMKIQEDLVWDKHTGELIGFVDLGDEKLNITTLKNTQELATHVLVFLVKSIVNPLSYSFATFATTGANSFHIFTMFWRAVMLLEGMNLKVIAATADGASPNRKFFKMHKGILVTQTKMLFIEQSIFIV